MEDLHMRTHEFGVAENCSREALRECAAPDKRRRASFLVLSGAALLLLPACSVNVKKESNGQDKQVDINTLLGGIHVSKDADVADIGLDVYPGAHIKEKDKEKDGHDKSANVRISGFGYGLKVVALEYQSDDSPANILAFYKDRLRKYGNVLECH